jgi:hypothetical protein
MALSSSIVKGPADAGGSRGMLVVGDVDLLNPLAGMSVVGSLSEGLSVVGSLLEGWSVRVGNVEMRGDFNDG